MCSLFPIMRSVSAGGCPVVLYGHSMTQDTRTHVCHILSLHFLCLSSPVIKNAQMGTSGLEPLPSLPTSLWHREALSWKKDNQPLLIVFIVASAFVFMIACYLWQVVVILHSDKASFLGPLFSFKKCVCLKEYVESDSNQQN